MRRDVFQAIADPTRREIINFIAHRSMTVNTVAESFDISRQAVSNHIKILAECGIIVVNQQGRERYCYVQPKKLEEVSDWVENFRQLWEQQFSKLDQLLLKMQAAEAIPAKAAVRSKAGKKSKKTKSHKNKKHEK